jgi:hypothetical protein
LRKHGGGGFALRITISSDDIRAEVGITGENVHLINEFLNTILQFLLQRKRTSSIPTTRIKIAERLLCNYSFSSWKLAAISR